MPFQVKAIKSPFQLFFEGIQHEANSSEMIPSDIDVLELTGNHVAVPRIKFVPCSLLEEHLHNIDPLQSCSDNGVTYYTTAIEACGLHLSSQCNQCCLL